MQVSNCSGRGGQDFCYFRNRRRSVITCEIGKTITTLLTDEGQKMLGEIGKNIVVSNICRLVIVLEIGKNLVTLVTDSD